MQIEQINIKDLKAYAHNSRTHDKVQIKKVADSIAEFGFTNPVLVRDDLTIIAGHARVDAAKLLKMAQVPCVRLSHLSPEQARAYVIADNSLALLGGWDMDVLKFEVSELFGANFNCDLLGLDNLDDLLSGKESEGLTDPDDVPEPPEEPKTKLGDVYLLGKHRLMCGDSTSIADVEKLMNEQKADMVFTDPPYGMSFGGGRARGDHALDKRGRVLVKAHGMILGDDKAEADLIALVRDAVACACATSKTGTAYYICSTWRTYAEFESAIESVGLKISACIVWDKKSIGLGNSNYRPQHEFIFYVKGGAWFGDKAQSDVWYMTRGATGEYVHPTQKPVELIEQAICDSSKRGDAVLDLFGGSGSTLIACEKTGREARLMELDPRYCDVIVKRWENYTGKQAVLEIRLANKDCKEAV